MQFKEYLRSLTHLSNRPVSLDVLLAPFGITDAPRDADEFLLVGHVADALSEQMFEAEIVSPESVIETLMDLGFEVV